MTFKRYYSLPIDAVDESVEVVAGAHHGVDTPRLTLRDDGRVGETQVVVVVSTKDRKRRPNVVGVT